MSRFNFLSIFSIFGLFCHAASGSGYEPWAASRAVTPRVALTNESMSVRVTITNSASSVWRGFVYVDHVPSNLEVIPTSLMLNGEPVTNYVFEIGNDGDVYPGCTPWRWTIETPTNLFEANPVPAEGLIEITYALTSASAGTFQLGDYCWSAAAPADTNASFGHIGSFERRTVKFVSSTNEPLLTAQFSLEETSLRVDGVPDSIYLLLASTNLLDWLPLATNLSPFNYLDTDTALFPHRFFRAAEYTVTYADMVFQQTPTNGVVLWVYGVAGCPYVVETSQDMAVWSPMVTNIAPFEVTQTNESDSTTFYRARLLDAP